MYVYVIYMFLFVKKKIKKNKRKGEKPKTIRIDFILLCVNLSEFYFCVFILG